MFAQSVLASQPVALHFCLSAPIACLTSLHFGVIFHLNARTWFMDILAFRHPRLNMFIIFGQTLAWASSQYLQAHLPFLAIYKTIVSGYH